MKKILAIIFLICNTAFSQFTTSPQFMYHKTDKIDHLYDGTGEYPVWVDNFDYNCDTVGLKDHGYSVYYKGDANQAYMPWFQAGNHFIFVSKEFYYSTSTLLYVVSAYISQEDSISDLDNWLVTPAINIPNDDYIMRFRCRESRGSIFPDSLLIQCSTGSTPEDQWQDIAHFRVVKQGRWVFKTFPLNRTGNLHFAIRHKVVNAGVWGPNGNYVGVDNIEFKSMYDVNSDGNVDMRDVLEVYNHLGETGFRTSDVNLDEIVDVSDVLIIYNKLKFY